MRNDAARARAAARQARLAWLFYCAYGLAAALLVLYDVYAPAPPRGRSVLFYTLTTPLTFPGWVLYAVVVLGIGGVHSNLAEVVFTDVARAAIMILGCLGIPLLGAHLLHRGRQWWRRNPRQ